jgi:excisionase family DNA binding protein
MRSSNSRAVPDPAVEPFITAERAAAVTGVSRAAGYEAVARGDWPSIRIGRSVRIPTARWLAVVGLSTDTPET